MRGMRLTLRLLWKSLLLLVGSHAFAQSPDKGCKPPKNHELWHDRIDREQKNALKADGKPDQFFYAGNNEDVNYYVTLALTSRIDDLQCRIEKDSTTKDQQKVGYLRGVENLLRSFISFYRSRQFAAAHFPTALEAYEAAMTRDKKGETIEPVIVQHSYDVRWLVAGN